MKAIKISEFGGLEVMKLGEVSLPKLNENEVLVRIKSIGVNFIDIYDRTGLYPVELPYILGLEASGVIEDNSNKFDGLKVGDRVAFCGVPGCYSEFVIVPKNKLVTLPDEIDYEYGAALMLQGMTAHYLTKDTYKLQPGDVCLIHAAAGGAGLLLVQLAKLAGAYVIGTVSNNNKIKIVQSAGADRIINYTDNDFESEVKDITDGKGVNVVYDSVGKSTFEKSLNCLSRFGLLVLYGQSSGSVPPMDPTILNKKGSLFLTRPNLFHYIAEPSELKRRAKDIFDWFTNKKIKIQIDSIFPLEKAADAHRRLQSRQSKGKILLSPDLKRKDWNHVLQILHR